MFPPYFHINKEGWGASHTNGSSRSETGVFLLPTGAHILPRCSLLLSLPSSPVPFLIPILTLNSWFQKLNSPPTCPRTETSLALQRELMFAQLSTFGSVHRAATADPAEAVEFWLWAAEETGQAPGRLDEALTPPNPWLSLIEQPQSHPQSLKQPA
jgi:hypothetical protein